MVTGTLTLTFDAMAFVATGRASRSVSPALVRGAHKYTCLRARARTHTCMHVYDLAAAASCTD